MAINPFDLQGQYPMVYYSAVNPFAPSPDMIKVLEESIAYAEKKNLKPKTEEPKEIKKFAYKPTYDLIFTLEEMGTYYKTDKCFMMNFLAGKILFLPALKYDVKKGVDSIKETELGLILVSHQMTKSIKISDLSVYLEEYPFWEIALQS